MAKAGRNLQRRLAEQWARLIAVDTPDEELARLGRLFNTLLIISIGIGTAVSIAMILTMVLIPEEMETSAWRLAVALPLSSVFIAILCLFLSHRGYVRQTASLYVWVNFFGIALAVWFFSGPLSPAWFLYSWTIAIAGILLAPGYALGMAAMVMGYFGILVLLSGLGLYTPPFSPLRPEHRQVSTIGLGLIMLVPTVGLLTYLNMRSLREAMNHLQAATKELEEQHRTLELRVADRTRALEKRAALLATAAEVGRTLASILELDPLAQRVVELIRERFDLYYAGLFLIEQTTAGSEEEYAVLVAGTGTAGRLMREQGHRLRVGGASMVGEACARKEPRLALDVADPASSAEIVRFDNPLLPETRSEMALPLLIGERVLGALDVQSTRPAAFSQEDIAVLRLVADQVAVAVDNARKFSEEATLLETASPLFRISRRLTEATTTLEIAQVVIDLVSETEADGCAVARFDLSPAGQVETVTFLASWHRRRSLHLPMGVPLPPHTGLFPLEMTQQFMDIEDVTQDPRVSARTAQYLSQLGASALLNVPLRAGERVIGFLIVERAAPGPWSPVTLRLYETLADQAAMALGRASLLEETQQRAERERTIRDLSDRVTASFDLDTILQTALNGLGAMAEAGGGYIELRLEEGR